MLNREDAILGLFYIGLGVKKKYNSIFIRSLLEDSDFLSLFPEKKLPLDFDCLEKYYSEQFSEKQLDILRMKWKEAVASLKD
ncbi:MAG: hypothetical protein KDK45_09790, partial [Leptospiraceae bacterium]|nr:hypothetical protein [Leptospiraceae bacterium]